MGIKQRRYAGGFCCQQELSQLFLSVSSNYFYNCLLAVNSYLPNSLWYYYSPGIKANVPKLFLYINIKIGQCGNVLHSKCCSSKNT